MQLQDKAPVSCSSKLDPQTPRLGPSTTFHALLQSRQDAEGYELTGGARRHLGIQLGQLARQVSGCPLLL